MIEGTEKAKGIAKHAQHRAEKERAIADRMAKKAAKIAEMQVKRLKNVEEKIEAKMYKSKAPSKKWNEKQAETFEEDMGAWIKDKMSEKSIAEPDEHKDDPTKASMIVH